MPNGIDPVPQAIVYVPREITEFPGEVRCEICDQITDNSYVSAVTADDGTFTLGPIPTAENATPGFTARLVAQKGRFRKVVDLTIQNVCAANSYTGTEFKLPGRTNGFDNIPRSRSAAATASWSACCRIARGRPSTCSTAGRSAADQLRYAAQRPPRMKTSASSSSTAPTIHSKPAQQRDRARQHPGLRTIGRAQHVTDWSADFVVVGRSVRSSIRPQCHANASTGADERAAIGEDAHHQATVLDDGSCWLQAVESVTG
jgi:hypothetical protein